MTCFVDTWLRKVRTPKSISLVATFALFLAVWLNAVQLSLSLDASTSFNLFLSGEQAARSEILEHWRRLGVRPIAVAALVVDFAFIPAYGFFLIMFARAMHRRLKADAVPTDVVSFCFSPATIAANKSLRTLAWLLEMRRALAIATLLLMTVDVIEDICGLFALADGPFGSVLHLANGAKSVLIGACGLLAFVILAVWMFEIGQPEPVPGEPVKPTFRAVFRRDAADVVWRSRYALGSIALFAGLVLVMNQGQDVLVGIASAKTGALYAILVSVVAVWLFSYSSYLWPRILCLTRRPSNLSSGEDSPDSQIFAKWWPRLLGATPLVMLTLLCGHAAQVSFSANSTEGARAVARILGIPLVGLLLLACATVCIALAAGFLLLRAVGPKSSTRREGGYFEVLDSNAARDEVMRGEYRIFFVIPRATITLIPVSLVGVGLLRWWGLDGAQAPLALAAIGTALALWSSVLGQVSALAIRKATPWVFIAVVVSGLLGTAGLTDNHRVALYVEDVEGMTLFGMSIAAIALGIVWALFGVSQMLMTRAQAQSQRGLQALFLGLLAVLTAAVLFVASHVDGRSERAVIAAADQQRMDEAIVGWIMRLCKLEPNCKSGAPADAHAFVVSSEGGGIRAAYWTALTLSELTLKRPEFAERTFSISSVSGGSVGAAAYRVCLAESARGSRSADIDGRQLTDCIQRFGAVDLLTPLLSSWLFEDVMSRIVPAGWCATPGCGFMSRGLWFERVLEDRTAVKGSPAGAQTFGAPLNGLKDGRDPSSAFAPHLFLNATAVESGERAIASDVRISPNVFPNARDQQLELGGSLKLSTAAHNSARFPFVNAIGSVTRSDGTECLYRGKVGELRDRKPGQRPLPDCLHLADGGYFDNSGAQTTLDIVRAIRRVLQDPSSRSEEEVKVIAWMQTHLRLTGVFLRFGEQSDAEREQCRPPEEAQRQADASSTGAEQAGQPKVAVLVSSVQAPVAYDPTTPTCQGPLQLYSDVLGPAVTAKNVGGTGAGGRLAESRLIGTLQALWPENRPAGSTELPPVLPLELRSGAVLYPLGWYLSPQARSAMEGRGREVVSAAPLR